MEKDKCCIDCVWWGYCHKSEEETPDLETCERFRERES